MDLSPWIWVLAGIGGMGESQLLKPQIAPYRNAPGSRGRHPASGILTHDSPYTR